jgi:hypothetical protein
MEFRCDQAAKAATRLARARLAVRDPSTTPWQRWLAEWRVRRASALHRSLLAEIAGAEGNDVNIAFMAGSFVPLGDGRH